MPTGIRPSSVHNKWIDVNKRIAMDKNTLCYSTLSVELPQAPLCGGVLTSGVVIVKYN